MPPALYHPVSRSETPGYRAMSAAILNETGLFTSLFSVAFCILLCDMLFWGGLGAGVPAMIALYEAFAFWLFRGKSGTGKARLLAIPMGIISLGFLLHWNPGSQFISVLTLLALLSAQLVLFSGVSLRGLFTFDLFSKAFLNIFIYPLEYLDFPFRALGTLKNSKSAKARAVTQVFFGLLLALPAAGILISLFSSADAMFEHLADTVADILGIQLGQMIFDVIFGGLTAIFVAAALLYNRGGDLSSQKARELSRRWDPVICGTFLSIIDLIVAAFVAVQFTYFFGVRPLVLAEGLTYAEYARRGFFELAWATGLVFAISVMILTFCRPKENRRLPLFIRAAILFLCLCNGVVLVSAIRRMLLYVEVYGLSVKRLLTLWFMVLIGLFLLWLVLRCLIEKFRAASAIGVTVLAMVSLLSLCNVDRAIAGYNVDLYLTGSREIDADYLGLLSYSAVPETVRLGGVLEPALFDRLLEKQAQSFKRQSELSAFTLDRPAIASLLSELSGFTLDRPAIASLLPDGAEQAEELPSGS
ncbi:MAG: DUF4173 domain-containing protein [Oscillospiraceae bacterium]|nr:DUF4173 domain-containing protein [Oscillospiraceae bacterium]